MQERRNSIANTLEFRLFCTNPSTWSRDGAGAKFAPHEMGTTTNFPRLLRAMFLLLPSQTCLVHVWTYLKGVCYVPCVSMPCIKYCSCKCLVYYWEVCCAPCVPMTCIKYCTCKCLVYYREVCCAPCVPMLCIKYCSCKCLVYYWEVCCAPCVPMPCIKYCTCKCLVYYREVCCAPCVPMPCIKYCTCKYLVYYREVCCAPCVSMPYIKYCTCKYLVYYREVCCTPCVSMPYIKYCACKYLVYLTSNIVLASIWSTTGRYAVLHVCPCSSWWYLLQGVYLRDSSGWAVYITPHLGGRGTWGRTGHHGRHFADNIF